MIHQSLKHVLSIYVFFINGVLIRSVTLRSMEQGTLPFSFIYTYIFFFLKNFEISQIALLIMIMFSSTSALIQVIASCILEMVQGNECSMWMCSPLPANVFCRLGVWAPGMQRDVTWEGCHLASLWPCSVSCLQIPGGSTVQKYCECKISKEQSRRDMK